MKKEKTIETVVEVDLQQAEELIVQAPKVENKINKVGSLLKEMRLQKGLKIADISKKLCIRKSYLESIEESNYVEVPPQPYGIGFVRSYATFLGLNSGNVVELYKEEVAPKAGKQMFMLEPQGEASVPNKKYLIVSLLAIALVYGGWSVYNSQNAPEEDASSIEEVAVVSQATDDLPIVVEDFSAEPIVVTNDAEAPAVQEASQVVVTDASFEGSATAPATTAPTAVTEPAAIADSPIVLKVKNETWVEVKDADKLYLSKVLKVGSTYAVPQGKGMILSVGKADGLEVLVDGVVTPVVKPTKKMNILLDEFMKTNH